MKQTLFLLIAVLMAAHVQAQRRAKVTPVYYDYIVAMDGLTANDDMLFEDDLIAAGFIVGKKAIAFGMRNKTTMPLQIVWDETNIIMAGVAQRVMPDGVKYADKDNSHSPTLIPPGAAVEKDMVPVNHIRYLTGDWFVFPLLPATNMNSEEERAKALALKDKGFSVFMTLQQGDTKYYYTWGFSIVEIVERK